MKITSDLPNLTTPIFILKSVQKKKKVDYRSPIVTYRKYALKQGNTIGVRFIKYDIQGVFLKCAEILPTRLFDNVED
jgi:hypothetical protein